MQICQAFSWIMAAGLAILGSSSAITAFADEPPKPVVIAHRGASGYLPEHTIAAYKLAIEQGADFIEPDLVMTKDGHFVARHDPYLSDSTDIAEHPEFADRKTTVTDPEGKELTDWFTWDFTLEELKTLKARQARKGRDTSHDGLYDIPVLEEIFHLVTHDCSKFKTGLYPETKWPSHHKARGLDMAKAFEAAYLKQKALLDQTANASCFPTIYLQSFEADILKEIDGMESLDDIKLVQLVYPLGYKPFGKPSYRLREIDGYADGVGPYKSMLIDLQHGNPTDYAERARALGLEIHTWTLRDDAIAPAFQTIDEEISALLSAGATGIFTDFPDTGKRVTEDWAARQKEAKSYQVPQALPGYTWYSDVGVRKPGSMTVPYDGRATFQAKSADRCRLACGVFKSCQAFLFVEPKSPDGRSYCRLLGRVPDGTIVQSGSHLYVPD